MKSGLAGLSVPSPTGGAAIDDRATGLLVVAILAFRVLFTATPFPVLLQQGHGATAPAFALGMTSIALSVVMVAHVARGLDLTARRFVPLLVADFVLSCAVGLSATGLPSGSDTSLHAVLWFPFHGTVMLWTVLLGAAWGCASVAAGVGLFVVLYAVERFPRPGAVPFVLTHAVWLTMPLLVAVLASVLLRAIVRAVLAHGMHVGRADEQVRMTRTLHDTVLQTLESMALRAHQEPPDSPDSPASPDSADSPDPADSADSPDSADPPDPAGSADAPGGGPGISDTAARRLRELRAVAARQAVELRQLLESGGPGTSANLAGMLAEFAGEFAAMGLRVELVLDELGEREPAPAVRQALRDAAWEALYNVVKHSGAGKAVVRAGLTADGVEVVVRDRGRGFDPAERPAGFGIGQSIVARMREAGGTAEVWSAPGRGTRVRLRA